MNAATNEFHCVAKEIPGAEGPCVTRDDRILMVSPRNGQILEIFWDGSRREIAHTGGRPAGLQIDRNNDVWVADMDRGILRVSLDGKIFDEVTVWNGAPMRGCNDCIFDSAGNLYFTAPAGCQKFDVCVGEVYCRCTDGRVLRLDEGYAFSNGIVINGADSLLIVAETWTCKLWGYDITEPGRSANKRLWATLPGPGKRGADGMDYDEAGRLVVTHVDGDALQIYDSRGNHMRTIALPFLNPSNVHFLKDGSERLLITELGSGALWVMHYGQGGQPQYGWQ